MSFESEELILVDEHDNDIGHLDKAACHDGDGILHRAFSLFVFNDDGELLLQKRAKGKRLWPGYWSNSCCSHPRRGEVMIEAVARRLYQELGINCTLEYLYRFTYHALYGDRGAERESCWVFAGRSSDEVRPNSNEIVSWRFIAPADLDQEISAEPESFTPWLKMEWEKLRGPYADIIAQL